VGSELRPSDNYRKRAQAQARTHTHTHTYSFPYLAVWVSFPQLNLEGSPFSTSLVTSAVELHLSGR